MTLQAVDPYETMRADLRRQIDGCALVIERVVDQWVLADKTGSALHDGKGTGGGGAILPICLDGTLGGLVRLPIQAEAVAKEGLAQIKAGNPSNPQVQGLYLRRLREVAHECRNQATELLQKMERAKN